MSNGPDLPVPLSSRIESATVYRRDALISRRAELPADLFAQANGGPVCARLVNLPLALQDGSVRVRLDSGNGATPDGLPVVTDVRVALEVGQPDPELRPPKNEELEAAQVALRYVAAELEANQEAIDALDKMQMVQRPKGEEGMPPRESPVDARSKFISFRLEHVRELQKKREELLKKKRKAHENLRELQDRENRASKARGARPDELRKAIIVTFRKSAQNAPEKTQLVVEYLISGATWTPGYGLRLAADGEGAEWTMRAMVAQDTGEDWKGVRLTLSTALPQRWTELPELASIRIGRTQPPKPRAGWRPAPQDTKDLFQDYLRAFPPVPDAKRKKPGTEVVQALELSKYEEAEAAEEGLDELSDEGVVMSTEAAPGALAAEPVADGAMLEDVEIGSMELAEEGIEVAKCVTGPAAPAAAPRGMLSRKSAKKGDSRVGSSVGPAVSRVRQPSYAEIDGGGRVQRRQKTATQAVFVEAVESTELTAQSKMLNYGRLYMPTPGEYDPGAIGQLRLFSRQEVYLRLINEQQISLTFSPMSVVERARRRAVKAASIAPAAGYTAPDSLEGFDYAYPAEVPVDIPSDGKHHLIPVLTRPAKPRRLFVSVPRESQHVFRCVEFKNPLDAPLLAGPVDVTVGGDFLMTVPLSTVPSGGNISLGLGVEERIRVARNTVYKEESSGLLGGEMLLTHQITVRVQNNLGQPAEVEIRERVPHVEEERKDEKIKVAIKLSNPPWEPYKQEEGGRAPLKAGYRWRLTVPASEARETQATYTITIPSKKQLTGGNRREEG